MNIRFFIGSILLLTLFYNCRNENSNRHIFELSINDFEKYPIWENCIFNGLAHANNDLNITESTFCPYIEKKPIDPNGYYLVKTFFKLADSSILQGYSINLRLNELPSVKNSQPVIIINNNFHISFWKGILGCDSLMLEDFYQCMNKGKNEIFPIIFYTSNQYSKSLKGTITGFSFCADFNCDTVKYSK
jgi:hypothetical protein